MPPPRWALPAISCAACARGGLDSLEQLPDNLIDQVRQRAEADASATARVAARDVLARLGIAGEVEVRPGGVVTDRSRLR